MRTLVTRLVEKEAVAADKSGANFKYYPLLSENECKNSEVKNFIDKVFDRQEINTYGIAYQRQQADGGRDKNTDVADRED